jgi:leader peptidase (prepilin peptidase) / N-methyltransferase
VTIETFAAIFAFGLGLIFGSFATVVAYRIPRQEGIVTGRSKCPSCGHEITALENIPLISYVFQRGRCRHCGARISPRYPLIELVTGLLFAASVIHYDVTAQAVVYAAFFWVLVVLTAIDLEHKLLPNRIVYPSFIVGSIGLVVAAAIDGEFDRLQDAALGVVIFGGFLFVVAFIVPAGMGGGDVKLAFVLGEFLGYAGGIGIVLVGMFTSFVLGALIGVVAMIVTGGNRKMQVPFGPFLAGGTVIALMWGRPVLEAYLDTL